MLLDFLAFVKSEFNTDSDSASGIVFLGLPFAFGSGVASVLAAAFAFAFALGAAPLDELSAGGAAFIDTVLG